MSEEKFILIPVLSCSFTSGKDTIDLVKGERYLLEIDNGHPCILLDNNKSVKLNKRVLRLIHSDSDAEYNSDSKTHDFLKYYYICDYNTLYPSVLVCSTSLEEAIKINDDHFGSKVSEDDCYEVDYDEVLNELTEDSDSTLDKALKLMSYPGILKTGPFENII